VLAATIWLAVRDRLFAAAAPATPDGGRPAAVLTFSSGVPHARAR
jgi:hypothetical protein